MTYGYDGAGRLVSVTDWDSNAITYGYDDANRMTTKTLPSGTDIVSTYTYDDAGPAHGHQPRQGRQHHARLGAMASA